MSAFEHVVDEIVETANGPAAVAWAAEVAAVLNARRAERIAEAAKDEERFVVSHDGGEPKFCHSCWLAEYGDPEADVEPPPIDEDDLVRDQAS